MTSPLMMRTGLVGTGAILVWLGCHAANSGHLIDTPSTTTAQAVETRGACTGVQQVKDSFLQSPGLYTAKEYEEVDLSSQGSLIQGYFDLSGTLSVVVAKHAGEYGATVETFFMTNDSTFEQVVRAVEYRESIYTDSSPDTVAQHSRSLYACGEDLKYVVDGNDELNPERVDSVYNRTIQKLKHYRQGF